MHARPASSARAEAAISAGDHIFFADYGRKPLDALGDEIRVLDEIGDRIDHARNQDFAVRQWMLFKDAPLVAMPRVSALHRQPLGVDSIEDVDDLDQWDVAHVWPFTIAPA